MNFFFHIADMKHTQVLFHIVAFLNFEVEVVMVRITTIEEVQVTFLKQAIMQLLKSTSK